MYPSASNGPRGARRWMVAAIATLGVLAIAATLLQRRARRAVDESVDGLIADTRDALADGLASRRRGDPAVTTQGLLQCAWSFAHEAVRRDPARAEAFHLRGRIHRALYLHDDALADQDAALERDPAFPDARYERAVLLARAYRRRLDESRRALLNVQGIQLAVLDQIERGGLGGATVAPISAADLEEKDLRLRVLKARLREDIERLAEGGGLPIARLTCVRGLLAAVKGRAEEAEALLEQAVAGDTGLEEAYEAGCEAAVGRGAFEVAVVWAGRGHEADRGYLPHLVSRAAAHLDAVHEGRRNGQDPGDRLARAEADCEQALAMDPGFVPALRNRAAARSTRARAAATSSAERERLYDAVIRDLDVAIGKEPTGAPLYLERAMARAYRSMATVERGTNPTADLAAALADVGCAVEADPTQAAAYAVRAIIHGNAGRYREGAGGDATTEYEAAVRDLGRALEVDPTFAQALLLRAGMRTSLGTQLRRRGKDAIPAYREGLADLDRLLADHPEYEEGWSARAQLRVAWAEHESEAGRPAEALMAAALGDLERLLQRNPRSVKARVARALLRMSEGAERGRTPGADADEPYRRALEDLDEAVEIDPRVPGLWLMRALARRDRGNQRLLRGKECDGDFAAAEADLERALERSPESAPLLFHRGEIRWHRGNACLARREDPLPHFQASRLDLDRAAEVLTDLSVLRLRRAELHSAWGTVVRADGADPSAEWAIADREFDAAVRLDPRSAEARWSRGVHHGRRGRWDAAVADFETGAQLVPRGAAAFGKAAEQARRQRDREVAALAAGEWVDALRRGDEAIARGDYGAAGNELERGLAAFGRSIAAFPEDRRELWKQQPDVVRAIFTADYNLACVRALQSQGKALPPGAQPPDAAAARALRDQAFARLHEAVRLGWNDVPHLEGDADLEALRADARWAELLRAAANARAK